MGDELKVTQADRDAAADVASSFGAEQVPPEMRAGKLDHHPTVQAFARHRIATETQSQATIDELLGALKECREEAEAANNVIRLNRDGEGSGRVKVATHIQRVADITKSAIAKAGGLQ